MHALQCSSILLSFTEQSLLMQGSFLHPNHALQAAMDTLSCLLLPPIDAALQSTAKQSAKHMQVAAPAVFDQSFIHVSI
jgi:hypothetical protein